MEFPTREADIVALSNRMLKGFQLHSHDFPKVNLPWLAWQCMQYNAMWKSFLRARSKARLATKTKNESFDELKRVMKIALGKSVVDTSSNPEKLKFIGWDMEKIPEPVELPGQSSNLLAADKENGNVELRWDRPSFGGRIRNYIIERCIGTSLSWDFAGISYRTIALLNNQPKGVEITYRIKASNSSGESMPGNPATIVL